MRPPTGAVLLTMVAAGGCAQIIGVNDWQDDPGGDPVTLSAILESWLEGSGMGRPGIPNWTTRYGSLLWSGPGCSGASIAPAPLATFVPGGLDQKDDVPINRATVQAWIDKPGENYGVAIRTAGTDGATFVSSEGVATKRPRLLVEYVANQASGH